LLTRVIRVHECGGPEVLRYETVEVPPPSAGEVLVRNCAIGLNFIDAYFRIGRYRAVLPFIPGLEGAGIVEEIGPGVEGISVGDRVGYIDPLGAYAEFLLRPADRLIKLPDSVDLRDAAAMLLKGMTAEYLLNRTYPVRAGEVVLIHAAAGGVGQILCQWAKHRISRQEGPGTACRMRSHNRDERRRVRSARSGNHRRQGRAGCVRWNRCRQFSRFARLPFTVRDDGIVRQCIGTDPAL
jgi:NADPH:quinone reductase-like Zn-dependent oxidoreductase